MIPPCRRNGNLPPGIHTASWRDMEARFGGSPRRARLLDGLRRAAEALRAAGCRRIYVDGSFVTAKPEPGDYEACWSSAGVDPEMLPAVFFDLSDGRRAQKAAYGGELFPAELPEGGSGRAFLEFFQTDRTTGQRKGFVLIE